jgi:arabinosyltransferase C
MNAGPGVEISYRQLASSPVTQTGANVRTARVVAAVAGLLGTLLAILTPFLPVKQTTAELHWPQGDTLSSVTAPLIGYVPIDLTISVPCRAAAGLNGDKTTLLSTVPTQAEKAVDRGLLIQRAGDDLVVVIRNTAVVSAPMSDVLSPACRELLVSARADAVTGEFVGLRGQSGDPIRGERAGDLRPQIVGVFTDLTGPAPPGLRFSATVDTRYSTSPTPLKLAVMLLGLALTVAALIALHILDGADGIRNRRVLPARWWSLRPLDGVVAGVLVWWHFVGANTSDDGYILTMARVSENAGYMANYYRWFGTPESPFGWYYDLLALWAHVSTASIWMRLPTLAMALACWWLISREVIPRLGVAVKHSPAAAWTAAGLFLAFWLPLNNGLRPEPIIALGILATWCAVERGVATSRLLPVAIACILGALTLFSGPTGVASIGALLVAVGPLLTIVRGRSRQFGLLPLLAPIAAAATMTVILIFRDQTFASVAQASALKRTVGPSLTWFDEHIRYARLFLTTPDGAIARRFAVLALILALVVAVAMMLRRSHIPGTATGPSRRIVGVTVICFLAMMLTPTKWTHHFGVFAGLAGAIGALAAVAVSAHVLGSRRNRAVFAAAALFVTALSFASVNGWWYVAGFGVPWADRMPEFRLGVSTVLLGLTILALLVAAWYHFSDRDDRVSGRLTGSPLAVLAWLLVIFEVGSLTMGMVNQYPAFSVGRSNLQALTGKTCGLADDVLVESAPGKLRPAGGTVVAGGFSGTGVPADVAADPVTEPPAGGNLLDEEDDAAPVGAARVRLPFGLDPATPVWGSWRAGVQQPARLRTEWYRLPARDSAPLLVVSAAGRFGAGAVTVEWATDAGDGEAGGSVSLSDIGPAPGWRNLRVPLAAVPPEATVVRVVAVDDDLAPSRWIAVAPPRVPALRTLQQEVGSSDPVLLDWLVGLAFPCQRPFGHGHGVTEAPKWRILPNQFDTEANSPVMDNLGGGPLGITELLFRAATVPTYLRDDWSRDWGALQRLTVLDPGAIPARLDLSTATRSGLWSPAPLRPA